MGIFLAIGGLDPDISTIQEAMSKDNALNQCKSYLKKTGEPDLIEVSSTGEAMRKIRDENYIVGTIFLKFFPCKN